MNNVEIVRPEQGGDAFNVIFDKVALRVGRDEEDSANVRVIISEMDGGEDVAVLRFESDTKIMVEAAKVAPNGEEYDNLEWNSNS